jgi:hypothetical protein
MEKLQKLTQTEGGQAVNDTPRTYDAYFNRPDPSRYDLAGEMIIMERELNAANAIIRQQQLLEEENLRLQDRIIQLEEELMNAKNKYAAIVADVVLYEDRGERIRLLISERDTARLQADQKISLREEFRELLGTDDIEQGVVVVRGLQERIKQLEIIISRARNVFFRDGSDGKAASGMLAILEEARKP